MTPTKLYIAGPMSGHYNFNKTAFHNTADILADRGYSPVMPFDADEDVERLHDIGGGGDWSVSPDERAWYLRHDFKLLLDCDGIVLLDGWMMSKGANLELLVAIAAGLDAYRFYADSQILRHSTGKVLPQIALVQAHLVQVAESKVSGLV